MQQTKPICALCRCPLPAGVDQSARLCQQCASIIESIREPSVPSEQQPGETFKFNSSGQLAYEPPRAESFFFDALQSEPAKEASRTAAPAEPARGPTINQAQPPVETAHGPPAPHSPTDADRVALKIQADLSEFGLSADRSASIYARRPDTQPKNREAGSPSWAEELRQSLGATNLGQTEADAQQDRGYVLMVADAKKASRGIPKSLKVAALLLLVVALAVGGYFLLRGGAVAARKTQAQLPAKVERARPAVSESPKPATAEAEPAGKYSLQAASFPKQEAANQFSERLNRLGIPAYVIAADIPKKGRWFRVRVGKFPSAEQARRGAIEFQRKAAESGFKLDLVVCDY